MNVNHRSVITKYWQYVSFAMVIGLALTLFAGHNLTQAQEPGEDDPRSPIAIPLGSTGLAYGEGFRATLTNLGNRSVNAEIRVIDSEGGTLKREALTLEPNQIRVVTMNQVALGRGETSALARAEVVVTKMDAPNLWLTGEVINLETGSTQFLTTSVRGPLMGSNLQHNETLLRD